MNKEIQKLREYTSSLSIILNYLVVFDEIAKLTPLAIDKAGLEGYLKLYHTYNNHFKDVFKSPSEANLQTLIDQLPELKKIKEVLGSKIDTLLKDFFFESHSPEISSLISTFTKHVLQDPNTDEQTILDRFNSLIEDVNALKSDSSIDLGQGIAPRPLANHEKLTDLHSSDLDELYLQEKIGNHYGSALRLATILYAFHEWNVLFHKKMDRYLVGGASDSKLSTLSNAINIWYFLTTEKRMIFEKASSNQNKKKVIEFLYKKVEEFPIKNIIATLNAEKRGLSEVVDALETGLIQTQTPSHNFEANLILFFVIQSEYQSGPVFHRLARGILPKLAENIPTELMAKSEKGTGLIVLTAVLSTYCYFGYSYPFAMAGSRWLQAHLSTQFKMVHSIDEVFHRSINALCDITKDYLPLRMYRYLLALKKLKMDELTVLKGQAWVQQGLGLFFSLLINSASPGIALLLYIAANLGGKSMETITEKILRQKNLRFGDKVFITQLLAHHVGAVGSTYLCHKLIATPFWSQRPRQDPLSNHPDPHAYEVLGIDPSTPLTRESLHKIVRYLFQTQGIHPDQCKPPLTQEFCSQRTSEVNWATEELSRHLSF